MGAAETRRAIEAAGKALPAWRALTAKERGAKLRRWSRPALAVGTVRAGSIVHLRDYAVSLYGFS